MAFHLYSRGKAVGPYLALAPIFPTNLLPDIRWGFDAIWNISIITTNSAVFEYTIDGGTTWFPFVTTTANIESILNVKADDKDSFNLRTTGGATVFRIIVSIAPEDIQRALQPLTVNIPQPLQVDICPVLCDVPVIIQNQPISVSQSANPLPVDICPVSCVIDVDIQNQPIEVTWPSALPVDICPVTCDVPIINGSVTPLDVQITNVIGTPVGKIIASETNFAILQDTDIFTATAPVGTSAGDAVVFRVQWSAIDGGILRYTLNDSDFVAFNDQNALKEDSSHIFDVIVEDGDLFTLQFEKDTTITFLRVIQLI